ncbi:MAG: acyl-CoA thioester hydrolase/BAAT C-terminal domain-containing protein [Nocardioides sp.]|uniref:acyl-CoA thioester hydrolase/BAAT C-terminal domain-containing protein n=1 Tax=Nocardioides sp. TaxID=35761 RepID=UPI0039E6F05D
MLAGSSGRIDFARAELLARNGAMAESIRWFGGAGQHDGPWEIPLELFLGRVAELKRGCDRVLVFGTSFGAEAALLTGCHSGAVDAVVAFAPSDVVWAGVRSDGTQTSHWTLGGVPLPYVPFDEDWESDNDIPAFVDLYEASRKRYPEHVAEAAIAVEDITDLLLVAGGDDQVWPADAMSAAIKARRTEHGLTTTIVSDPDAGHRAILPGEPAVSGGIRMRRGGTENADRHLGTAAWAQIQTLLRAGEADA